MNADAQIAQVALERLEQKTGITGAFYPNLKGKGDGDLELRTPSSIWRFTAECKREFRKGQLPQLYEFKAALGKKPFILIAEHILPSIKESLKEQQINYLETSGNAYIAHNDSLILVEGARAATHSGARPANRAFTKAGLKVVYALLAEPVLLKATYREIGRVAGISAAAVTEVVRGLKETKQLYSTGAGGFGIHDRKALFQKWLHGWETTLKPSLQIGRFRFMKADDLYRWKDVNLDEETIHWGGEPAADLLTHWLRPGELTVYTTATRTDIIRTFRVVPDEEGELLAYKKFWDGPPGPHNTVHPLLVYADLMITGDRRCIETAEKIYDAQLQLIL